MQMLKQHGIMLRYKESWCKPHLLKNMRISYALSKAQRDAEFVSCHTTKFLYKMKNHNPTSATWSNPDEWIQIRLTQENLKSDSAAVQWLQTARIFHNFCQQKWWLTYVWNSYSKEKRSKVGVPCKKICWSFFPWMLPLTPKGSVYVRNSISVMYCLLTLILFSLATQKHTNKNRILRSPSRGSIFLYNAYSYLGCSEFQRAVSK